MFTFPSVINRTWSGPIGRRAVASRLGQSPEECDQAARHPASGPPRTAKSTDVDWIVSRLAFGVNSRLLGIGEKNRKLEGARTCRSIESARARDGGNAAATRQAILEAATRRFATQGYQRAGVREIAADAGVTAALVNRYFGSKEGLFAEVIGRALDIRHLIQGQRGDLADYLARVMVYGREDPRDRRSSRGRCNRVRHEICATNGSCRCLIGGTKSAVSVTRRAIAAGITCPASAALPTPRWGRCRRPWNSSIPSGSVASSSLSSLRSSAGP